MLLSTRCYTCAHCITHDLWVLTLRECGMKIAHLARDDDGALVCAEYEAKT